MQKNSEFEELFDLMAASRKKCPWAKEKSFEECATDLLNEVKELLDEVEKKDNKKTMQELGDVFLIAMFLAVIAEENSYFNVRDSLRNAVEKFKHRKPWIFAGATNIPKTAAEAKALYLEAKKKEKK